MIFASVGSMLPFDRFVCAIDRWAGENPSKEVFIQIGDGKYTPVHAEFSRFIPHADYQDRLRKCRLFVAHVGMGSILQGLEFQKEMLLLPRIAQLGEHTTDHQAHTVTKFEGVPGIHVAADTSILRRELSRIIAQPIEPSGGISSFAPETFTSKLSKYLIETVRQKSEEARG